jgi:hypothetical protein
MNNTKFKVTDLQLPTCRYGFRSGWAFATVDGKRMKLHTSRSDRSDYREHYNDVLADFEAGKGEIS